jgi:hypothetical protein
VAIREQNPSKTLPRRSGENSDSINRFEVENNPRTELLKNDPKKIGDELGFIYRFGPGNNSRTEPPKNYPKRSSGKQVHLQVQNREQIENKTPKIAPKS